MKLFGMKCKQNTSTNCCSFCTMAINRAELYDHLKGYHHIQPRDMDEKTFWFAARAKLLSLRDRLDEMDRKDRELAMKLSKSIRWH